MPDESRAIEQLVAAHHQAVYRYAYRLAGSAFDAEDLVQQTFLAAQENLGQLQNGQAALSWLFTTLRRCFLRGRQRRQPIAAGDLEIDVETIPDDPPPPEAIDREQLQRALDDLPDHYRLVLAMFYYEDLSYREIAEKLELPLGTVMSRLARAKGRLRQRLFEPHSLGPAGVPKNERG